MKQKAKEKRKHSCRTITHTCTHQRTHRMGCIILGGSELPESDDDEGKEHGRSQEDGYNDGCDGPRPEDPCRKTPIYIDLIITLQ